MNKNKKLVGMEKSINKASNMLQSPCTITEAVQIARGVAEDALTDYHRTQNSINISMSIQLEILKDIVISSGMITEEDFRKKYTEKVAEVQKMQKDMIESQEDEGNGMPNMELEAGDVEVKVEE